MMTNQRIVGDFSGPLKIYLGESAPSTNTTPGGSWRSVNPSVATIDPVTGVITGVNLGIATIDYDVTQNGRTVTFTKTIEVTDSLAIGTGYGGGVIAYIYQSDDPGYTPANVPMLIAAINDYPRTLPWYPAAVRTWSSCISCNPDNLILGAGQQNTSTIATNLSAGAYGSDSYIFGAISSFKDGGFEDWFVPSRDELSKLQLQKDAIKGFSASNYWTSNDDMSPSRGTTVNFADGSLFAAAKNVTWVKTRLIRYAYFTISVPDAPTNVATTAGNGQVIVTFEAPISDGGSPIASYIATSNPEGKTGSVTQSGSGTITVTGLTNGTPYTFTVTATNAIGTSTPSAASSSVTPATLPGVPTNVAATAENNQATVTFDAPISNGGSTITGYTVTSSAGDTQSGTSSPIIVTGLVNGTAYTFTVTATNAIGTSTASAASNSVTPVTVPGVPTNVAATAGNNQATVTFEAPISDGGSPITGYTVTSSAGDTQSGTSSPIIVTGLVNGTAYTFTVTATNAIGTSTASAASNSVTPVTVPGVPTNVAATAGNNQATVIFSTPISDGGSPITGYTVTSSNGTTQSGASSPITVTGLANGTAYTFTVTATNSVGTSGASTPSNVVTPAPAPSPPTNVIAVAMDKAAAKVSFTTPVSDGGSSITGYTVTSSAGDTKTGVSSPITVTGLTKGTAYTFTVTATNAVGTSGASSQSNQITAVSAPSYPILTADKPIGDGQVTLNFKAPEDDGGSPVTSYTAFCFKEDGKTLVGTISVDAANVPSTIKSIVYTGLTNGTRYGFRIIATNSVGDSPKGTNLQYVTLN